MDCYILYGNNNTSYNYCDNKNEMQHLEKKKKKKQTCGSKEVKLSTDPQSVAARERRHRISERFKILQSLVPGGSKLDTVSMLEEAIVYIKFLKTQLSWLIYLHTHQSQHNIINSNNHLFIDEQLSTIINDLPCDDRDTKQISTQDDCGSCVQTANDYDHAMSQILEFQDSWFQIEGAQKSMHLGDVLLGSW